MNNLKIFFISEENIKEQTSIMADVENQFIRQHILEAQNIDLQPVICEDYYDYLVSGLTAYYDCIDSGGTCLITSYLTAEDIKLLDNYIQPFLIYSTLYQSAYDLFLRITNRGVASIDNNNGRTAAEEDLKYYKVMRIDWKNKQTHYMNAMIKYLTDNIDDYPLYKSCVSVDCSIDDAPAANYGLYLGKNI